MFPLILFALLASPLARGQAPPRWMEQYQSAAAQLQRGNLAEANQQFAALWKANSTDAQLALAIGTAFDSTGHHPDATEWYLKALKLDPRLGPAYNNLALNYIARGEYGKALPLLEKVTQLDPQDEKAVYNLGLARLQSGQYSKAALAFQRAHDLKPNEGDPLLRMAYADFLAGEKQEGMKALESFLRLPGDERASTLQAVQVLNSAGLYAEAAARAEKARETGAGSAELTYEEVTARFQLHEYKQAADLLQKDSSSQPVSVDYDLLLGSAQALSGDLPDAVKTLQTAARLAPENPQPYYRLALVLLQGFRDQDAQEALKTGLQLIPDSPLLLYAMGIANDVGGHYNEAIEWLRKSLAAEADQAGVWAVLAELYVKVGQYEPGAEAYQKAIRLRRSPETVVQYADLLIHLQKYSEAEALLKPLARTYPDQEQVYVTLGKLYNAQKAYPQAEKALRRAIELDPDDANAHWFLTSTLQHTGRLQEAKREGDLATEKRSLADQRERKALLRAALVPLGESARTGAIQK